MKQIEIFSDWNHDAVRDTVNKFIAVMNDDITISNIQFSTEKNGYAIMVVYEKKNNLKL